MVYSLPNGSLIFYPFTAEKYRHEIHSTIYRQVIILGAASLFRYYYLFIFLSGKCLLIIASQCKMLTAELLPFFYHSLQFALFLYSHSIIFFGDNIFEAISFCSWIHFASLFGNINSHNAFIILYAATVHALSTSCMAFFSFFCSLFKWNQQTNKFAVFMLCAKFKQTKNQRVKLKWSVDVMLSLSESSKH